jgi:hypothetical protein
MQLCENRLHKLILVATAALLTATGDCPVAGQEVSSNMQKDWPTRLAKVLPVMGHRNWIVVADSAYPAQTRQGIETLYVGGNQLEAVRLVLQSIDKAKHIRGTVYLDSELAHVAPDDAPGIAAYRKQLHAMLKGQQVRVKPHEQIIRDLDEAAKTFRVLVLKTDMALPYTTVFVQLGCGYWNADAEKRLRERMKMLPKEN